MEILVQVSAGELLDKVAILEIKKESIKDENKLREIERELALSLKICEENFKDYRYWVERLKEVNKKIWEDIDKQWEKEKNGEYDPTCVQLSKDVLVTNDKRFQIKREINDFYCSEIKEQKSYDDTRENKSLQVNKKRALISGVTGQDGSYLAEFLLSKGYEVYGMERRVAIQDQEVRNERINNLNIEIIPCDITNYSDVLHALQKSQPDEVYHLAAQSFVALSWDDPFQTLDININGTLNLLEGIRQIIPKAKFYFAASSEMYGNSPAPQDEWTPMNPRSPYGLSKLTGYHLTKNYRESHNLFAVSGILFNHESPRRGKEFITRKITVSLARIKMGLQPKLSLGNLDSVRDWGYSKDYVEAIWLMLQQKTPEDFVVGTGERHSVREFLEYSAEKIGLDIKSNGKSGAEEAYFDKNGNVIVDVDPKYFRPAELNYLYANPAKARAKLGWEPKTKFKELAQLMAEYDLKLAKEEARAKASLNLYN